MNVSVLIATYGSEDWHDLAWSRAWPSAQDQGALEALCFHDPEGTIASVRNELGSTARGEWLLFLDADDEIAPGFLDAMKRANEQDRGDGPLLLTPAIDRPGRFYLEGPLEQTNWLVVGTLLERSLFEQVGGFPDYSHGFEDWALWLKCERAGARIVKVPDAVYLRHRNPNSKMKQMWRDPAWQVEMHGRVLSEL